MSANIAGFLGFYFESSTSREFYFESSTFNIRTSFGWSELVGLQGVACESAVHSALSIPNLSRFVLDRSRDVASNWMPALPTADRWISSEIEFQSLWSNFQLTKFNFTNSPCTNLESENIFSHCSVLTCKNTFHWKPSSGKLFSENLSGWPSKSFVSSESVSFFVNARERNTWVCACSGDYLRSRLFGSPTGSESFLALSRRRLSNGEAACWIVSRLESAGNLPKEERERERERERRKQIALLTIHWHNLFL